MATAKLASPTSFTFHNTTMATGDVDVDDDDDFSQYHSLMIRDTFSLELGNWRPVPNPSSSLRITIGKKKEVGGGEIGVFGAEKYFSGAMDGDKKECLATERRSMTQLPSMKKEGKIRVTSKSGSLSTTSSEASGHSQSTLLRDRRRPLPESARNSFLSAFWCYCSGKHATKVDEDKNSTACKKVLSFNGYRDDNIEKIMEAKVEPFGSPVLEKPVNFGRVARKEEEEEDDEDDLGSESSSDLFEIESLSITGTRSYFRSEGTGSCYEPSEASIEWSVVTASAANFSVAASEHDQASWIALDHEAAKKRPGGHRKPPGILLGCVSQKAVNVTMDAYKKPEKVGAGVRVPDEQLRLESSLPPVARYHASRPIYTQ